MKINSFLETNKRNLDIFLFCVTVVSIIYVTILSRAPSLTAQSELTAFWSYKLAFEGNKSLAREIALNIVLFIPVGYFISTLLGIKNRCILVVFPILSLCIEITQYILHRGLFEFDDIINNTIGALIGVFIYLLVTRVKSKAYLHLMMSVLFAVAGVGACLYIKPQASQVYEKEFAFQAETNGNFLYGFCFAYGKDAGDSIQLVLRSDQDNELITTSGISLSSVDRYFKCEHNYENCGFIADISEYSDKEYEILVAFPGYDLRSTGTFLKNGRVVRSLNSGFKPEGYLENIAEEGTFLLYCNHCYVYQYQGELYWIAEDGFTFEDDGTTYIQYQLFTTQPDKLPTERLDDNYDWDNRGFYFENYEIERCGAYRVAKQSIPKEYSIIAIETGYYKDGRWIWKRYFRPDLTELIKNSILQEFIQ